MVHKKRNDTKLTNAIETESSIPTDVSILIAFVSMDLITNEYF